MPHRTSPPIVVLLALLLLSPASVASAQEIRRRSAATRDVWSEPNPGVRYLRRTTTTPCDVHALIVDLRADGVRLIATRYDERWSTVAEHARARSLAAAVNGGFWGALQRPRGLAAGGGALWPSAATDPEMGFFAIDTDGRPMLRAPGEEIGERELARIAEAVSGRPILLDEGAIDQSVLDAFPTANQRQPRTAIGLSEDRHTAIVVVVDGRRRTSRGMTLYELARLLAELGAHDAINLDGGGSSEMYVGRAGGVVNVPSRGRWEIALDAALAGESSADAERSRAGESGRDEVFVRGVEREVLN
nr:phosphodiester glycosidase family protein [Myxococcota bacterium]